MHVVETLREPWHCDMRVGGETSFAGVRPVGRNPIVSTVQRFNEFNFLGTFDVLFYDEF